VIAVNGTQKPREVKIFVDGLDGGMRMPFEGARTVVAKKGEWRDRFDALEAKVYMMGDEPE
jgi:hypothetical protein